MIKKETACQGQKRAFQRKNKDMLDPKMGRVQHILRTEGQVMYLVLWQQIGVQF